MHAPAYSNGRGQGAARQGDPAPAERVVLIHCSASSARQWDVLTGELSGYHAVAPDLYGHGKRPRWHGDGALTLAHEAAAIWNVFPEGEPFHLVGHSYGGAVTLRFALSFPERVRSLTLIEPSAFHILTDRTDAQVRALSEIQAVADTINRAVLCGDYRGGMEVFIDYWGGPGSWHNTPDERKAQFAALAVCVANHFWSLVGETTRLSACRDIQVPTLLLCGTNSPGPSKLIANLLADAIPHAQHRVIHGAGHMSPLTHPTQVNALILEHLRHHGAQNPQPPFGSTRFASISGALVQAL